MADWSLRATPWLSALPDRRFLYLLFLMTIITIIPVYTNSLGPINTVIQLRSDNFFFVLIFINSNDKQTIYVRVFDALINKFEQVNIPVLCFLRTYVYCRLFLIFILSIGVHTRTRCCSVLNENNYFFLRPSQYGNNILFNYRTYCYLCACLCVILFIDRYKIKPFYLLV